MFNFFKKKEEKVFTDEELFSSLENDGIQLTEEQIQKMKNDDGKVFYSIGDKYYDDKNYTKALAWFRKGAAQNNCHSQFMIGLMYDKGLCVLQDYQQAMDWYLKAVNNNGNSDAQYNIGYLYHYGQGVPQDYKQAMDWYLKAVNKDGNKFAQGQIGYLYQNGYGVPKNIHTAMEWYTKAANQGLSYAQFNLGLNYEYEDEIKDLQKSVNWYKKAADNGNVSAKDALKRLNEQGFHPKDDIKDQ